MSAPAVRVAFVCVQHAGRSQMAAAFAEEERQRRGLVQAVDIVTGGTRPADQVHEGSPLEDVRSIRDAVDQRVGAFFDELEAEVTERG